MSDKRDRMPADFGEQEYRDLADSAAAAAAFSRGELVFLPDEPAELPSAPEGDVLVVRSLRLTVDLELRVKAIAEARGVKPTVLMREWITDGVEAAANGEQRDPVTELHRIADAASRALRALEGGRDAA